MRRSAGKEDEQAEGEATITLVNSVPFDLGRFGNAEAHPHIPSKWGERVEILQGEKQLRKSSGTQGHSYIMAGCSEANGSSDAGEKFGSYL